jgi:hypothetical protein
VRQEIAHVVELVRAAPAAALGAARAKEARRAGRARGLARAALLRAAQALSLGLRLARAAAERRERVGEARRRGRRRCGGRRARRADRGRAAPRVGVGVRIRGGLQRLGRRRRAEGEQREAGGQALALAGPLGRRADGRRVRRHVCAGAWELLGGDAPARRGAGKRRLLVVFGRRLRRVGRVRVRVRVPVRRRAFRDGARGGQGARARDHRAVVRRRGAARVRERAAREGRGRRGGLGRADVEGVRLVAGRAGVGGVEERLVLVVLGEGGPGGGRGGRGGDRGRVAAGVRAARAAEGGGDEGGDVGEAGGFVRGVLGRGEGAAGGGGRARVEGLALVAAVGAAGEGGEGRRSGGSAAGEGAGDIPVDGLAAAETILFDFHRCGSEATGTGACPIAAFIAKLINFKQADSVAVTPSRSRAPRHARDPSRSICLDFPFWPISVPSAHVPVAVPVRPNVGWAPVPPSRSPQQRPSDAHLTRLKGKPLSTTAEHSFRAVPASCLSPPPPRDVSPYSRPLSPWLGDRALHHAV